MFSCLYMTNKIHTLKILSRKPTYSLHRFSKGDFLLQNCKQSSYVVIYKLKRADIKFKTWPKSTFILFKYFVLNFRVNTSASATYTVTSSTSFTITGKYTKLIQIKGSICIIYCYWIGILKRHEMKYLYFFRIWRIIRSLRFQMQWQHDGRLPMQGGYK